MSPSRSSVEDLATAGVGRLLLRYSWPAMLSMGLNALYAVVDRFYIGQGCGEAAMAGLQLAFPVLMFFGACGVFIGVGHATLLSIKLGEGNRDACEKVLGELVAMKVALALVLPPLVFFNADTVLRWCGGGGVGEDAFRCARTYLRTIVFAQIFSHVAFGLSGAMRSEGDAVRSMSCMVVGFVANMALDPLMIFGTPAVTIFGREFAIPAMGIEGAAWATNVSMAASCAFALRHYLAGRSAVRLRLSRCRFYRQILWRTSALGFAPFLQQLLGSLIGVSLSAAFSLWAPDPASATRQIASLGVFNSMLILTIMPVVGLQQGLQPIFGYNWGARNFDRVKRTLVIGFWATTALCVLSWTIQCVPPFPTLMARLFVDGENTALVSLAAHDMAVANCMIWTISVNVVATTYFQAIGHPGAAVALSTLRQGVILLPCVWLLPHLMNDKPLAIWLALPISDVLCQLATATPLLLHLRFLSRVRRRAAPLPPVRRAAAVALCLAAAVCLAAAPSASAAVRTNDYSAVRGTHYRLNGDPEKTSRELEWGRRIGLNAVRFWTPSLGEWRNRPDYAAERCRVLVRAARSKGMRFMPIIFNGNGLNPRLLDEKNWPDASRCATRCVESMKNEPGLLAWDLMNEPTYSKWAGDAKDPAERKRRREKTWAFVRRVAALVRSIDPDTPLTVGCSDPGELKLCAAFADVLSFHDYSATRTEQEKRFAVAAAAGRRAGKPVLQTETGCPGMGNPYDMAIEASRRHGFGWFFFNLTVEGYTSSYHGVFNQDGTVRDPAALAAIMGFFRQRDLEKIVPATPFKPGKEQKALDLANSLRRIAADALPPAGKKRIQLFETMERAANLLEACEAVPMAVPPTAKIAAWRKSPTPPADEIKSLAGSLAAALEAAVAAAKNATAR